jgi:hypothetical protein
MRLCSRARSLFRTFNRATALSFANRRSTDLEWMLVHSTFRNTYHFISTYGAALHLRSISFLAHIQLVAENVGMLKYVRPCKVPNGTVSTINNTFNRSIPNESSFGKRDSKDIRPKISKSRWKTY